MKGQIIGLRKLSNQLNEMSDDLRSYVAKQMAVTLAQMNRDVKKGINTGARTGVTYKRGGKKRRRSAPGELPKTETGDLVSKFSTKVDIERNKVTGVLENSSGHAAILEFGDRIKGGRPFMRPLWRKWHQLVFIKFVTIMRRSLRGNSK